MAFISSGFRLLPYAGILPLPFSIAPASSSSLIFATSGSAKLRTFIALPVGVSPFPSTPWHAAHFCLYSAALFSSAFVGAQNIVATKSKPIPRMSLVDQFLCIKCLPPDGIRNTNGGDRASLESVSHRKRDEIAPEISRRENVLHCAGGGVFVVAVIIPQRLPGPVPRKLIIEAAKRMQPFRIERAGHLIGNQRLGIEAQLGAFGSGQVGTKVGGEMPERRDGEIEVAVVGFVCVGGELLHQASNVGTRLDAGTRLPRGHADVTD